MVEHKPHPANIPGDFYVEDGCCLMCEMPLTEAPDLFGACQEPYPHCHVKRQPQTAAERDQMVNAIRYADTRCIRYRGTDRLIQLRLVELGEGGICDALSPDLQERSTKILTGSSMWRRLFRWWRGIHA